MSSAYDSRNNIINELGAELRANIKKHKAADGYSTAIGSALDIIGESPDFNPDGFQPELNVEYYGGALKFRFTKKGVTSVNIYFRRQEEVSWQLLLRATNSPFRCQPFLESPNKPEHWEFRAFGLLNDVQIGQPSKIAEITFSM